MNSICSIARTIDGQNITFDMEPKLPKLQNLAGHAADCKGKSTEKMQVVFESPVQSGLFAKKGKTETETGPLNLKNCQRPD
jgi:hypothetical protein